MLIDERPATLSEELIRRIVHTFYDRVGADEVLGPIFEAQLNGRWDAHLDTMVDFWSSVAFEVTVSELCDANVATFFVDRAHRIADSLQIGLNIGPKALHLPARTAAHILPQNRDGK